ncbi:acetone carboxylase gamma subunit [Amaricoccus macauensis]|uniref:Acetone carboxylase gamma subunit n=1 Tax=Amaricoccus macauensis TaxID=57001 RepID=A0A840STM1_9RHOB|nr:acetone carboxylase subunit gamma [Amaricoccus macauensis]MBB5223176.1 acetone carboxylase gamma subunit [Amaricoccus macauensis]
MTSYTVEHLAQLKDGRLPANAVHDMQSKYKDADRFFKILEVWQASVEWDDPILLPLAEHLFVVQKPDGRRVIKSKWGHEYGEAHENWKLHARVFVRDTEELMDEIYPRRMASHPDWMVIREYYDPVSGTLLEVEAVPPGYPPVHDFKPDIDTFYRDWLGKPFA